MNADVVDDPRQTIMVESRGNIGERTSKAFNLDLSELDMAWLRLKLDRPERCFVIHLYLFSWIEADLPGWLDRILVRMREGYAPSDCQISYVPKPGWMIRPGAVLELADEILFNALLARFHAEIWKGIGGFQGDPDIAYQFQPASSKPQWIRADFRIWREWREKSLAKLDPSVQFVLFADVAGFYENVDLPRLRSDLNSLGFDAAALELLMRLLNRWAQPRGKGIPQGHSPSDILAKIYMNPVDRALRNSGFKHLRYVDDIRVFCRDSLEAKRALLKLNDLLRNRGLNLQSAKTKIVRVDEARRKIDGIAPVIQTIHEQLKGELKSLYAEVSGYARLSDIERVLKLHPDAPPPEVLERAFRDHFSSQTDEEFDATLLHYLLTRLGKTKSRMAVNYCLGLLAYRPEETDHVLRYFGDVGLDQPESERLLQYAACGDALYDYQLYQIVRWFWEQSTFPARLVALCRKWVSDRNREQWLRTYCAAVLGAAGDDSDLEMLEMSYGSAATEVEKADFASALARMEIGRRNSFYGRILNDGELVRRAIMLVKRHPTSPL